MDAALQGSAGGEGYMGFLQGDFSASIYVLAYTLLKWEKLKIFEFVERKYNGNKRCGGGGLVRGALSIQRGQLKGT